jgi:hypothetical protein
VRRNWFLAAIVVGVASIAIAALIMRLTADDDAGSESATAWASSVCTSLGTWKSSIESLADVSAGSLNADTLDQKIGDAEEATSTLVSELKGLGAPDLESADELQQQVSVVADEVRTSVDALEAAAQEASDADSPQDFLAALAKLAPQFQALLEAVSSAVDELKGSDVVGDAKDELQQAFENAEPCQELQADG